MSRATKVASPRKRAQYSREDTSIPSSSKKPRLTTIHAVAIYNISRNVDISQICSFVKNRILRNHAIDAEIIYSCFVGKTSCLFIEFKHANDVRLALELSGDKVGGSFIKIKPWWDLTRPKDAKKLTMESESRDQHKTAKMQSRKHDKQQQDKMVILLNKRIENMKSYISEAKNEIEDVRKQKYNLESTNSDLSKQHRHHLNIITDLKEEIKCFERRLDKIDYEHRRQLDDNKHSRRERERHIDSLRNENEHLRYELSISKNSHQYKRLDNNRESHLRHDLGNTSRLKWDLSDMLHDQKIQIDRSKSDRLKIEATDTLLKENRQLRLKKKELEERVSSLETAVEERDMFRDLIDQMKLSQAMEQGFNEGSTVANLKGELASAAQTIRKLQNQINDEKK
jgi:hypothetical protein